MAGPIDMARYIAAFSHSPLSRWSGLAPWQMTERAGDIVRALLADLAAAEYLVTDEIAVHRSATIEPGSVLKGPLILGPACFVAAGACLRGGCWAASQCIFGPGSELKSSFVFSGTRLAHFNFVGDSLLGEGVNLEAGSIVCNHRHERPDKEVLVRVGARLRGTGSEKFGALIGDGARIGANAVIAPGALLAPGAIIGRAALCDQEANGPTPVR